MQNASVAQSEGGARWLCCQIGAREDYVVPRALQNRGMLGELITDVWAIPGSWISRGTNGFSMRFHSGLADARVTSANFAALTFEATSRIRGHTGWNLIIKRNDWFQRFALAQLERYQKQWEQEQPVLFAYSYAAYRIFQLARKRGWKTVLGQIDPGRADEQLVKQLYSRASQTKDDWRPAPRRYWEQWKAECDLADHIVVNSAWSQNALISEGVSSERITVIPLALERFPESRTFVRRYPRKFSFERPLRVLFLGQINLRKGAEALFEGIRLLKDSPIEFWFVGPCQVSVPEELKGLQRIRWFGVVPRNSVGKYYSKADVFILPTFSDGFGLTQLEAQCWKLPIVVSTHCGNVVRHGENGLILKDISAITIADTLRRLVNSPEELERMASASGIAEQYSLRSLATSLLNL